MKLTNAEVLENLKEQAKVLRGELANGEEAIMNMRNKMISLSGAIDILTQIEESDKEEATEEGTTEVKTTRSGKKGFNS